MTKVIGSYDDRDVSLLAQDQYFRQVHWSAPLTREEETMLLERVQRGKEERTRPCPDARVLEIAQAARDRLVEGFQWLVIAIARRVVHRFDHLELLDVIQEGNIGLLKAIEENDPQAGYPLRSLASVCIRWAIGDAWHNLEGFVRLPARDRGAWKVVDEVRRQLAVQLHREPTAKEVAHATQLEEKHVFELLTLQRWRRVESLQALSERYEVPEEQLDFVSLFEAAVSSASWRSEQVRLAVDQALTAAQREVVELRFGLQEQEREGWTRAEIAACVGVTSQCIDAREQAALGRLRSVLAASGVLPQGGQSGTDVIVCEECGAEYPRRRQASRYCGAACRVRVQKRRKREEQGEEVA